MLTGYWINWHGYFSQEGRHAVFFQIGGVDCSRFLHRLKGLSKSEIIEEGTGGQVMETCGMEDQSSDTEDEHSNGDQSTKANKRRKRDNTDVSWSQEIKLHREKRHLDVVQLEKVLREMLCVPLSSSCNVKKWMDHPLLRFHDKKSPQYTLAVSMVERNCTNLTFDDICTWIHSLPKEPIWYARRPNYYFNLEDSVNILWELLLFQYGSEAEAILFLQRVYDIAEKRLPKKNTMIITGAASSGKTYFVDVIMAFYISVGNIGNFVRGDNFPLNDAYNKRILLWNEPSISDRQFDTVKMIFGGDSCPAKIKYEKDAHIDRTPIFVTSNHDVVPQRTVWNLRCFFEKWNYCPILSPTSFTANNLDPACKPSPLAYEYLINKFVTK